MEDVKAFMADALIRTGSSSLVAVAQNAPFDRRFVVAAAGRTWTNLPLAKDWLCSLRTIRAIRSCAAESPTTDRVTNSLDDLFQLVTGEPSPRGTVHQSDQDTVMLRDVVMGFQHAGVPLAESG